MRLNSLRNLSLATWQGRVGFMLPKQIAPATPLKDVLLQPAQQAPNQAAAQGSVRQAPAGDLQAIPVLLLGAVAILVLALGAGLGMVISRRPAHQHI